MTRLSASHRSSWRSPYVAGLTLIAPALIAVALTSLGGCLNLDRVTKRPATTVHVLTDPGQARVAATTDPRTLLVLDTVAAPSIDSVGMAYQRSAGTLSRYQFSRWSTRPGAAYTELLRQRLIASGAFASVARAGGPVRGDLLLDTRLTAFQHDARDEPGEAVVIVDAELVDLATRRLIARTRIEQRAPASAFSAAGAARAFDTATARSLDQLGDWLERAREKSVN